jgi:hypothetical protein
MTESRPHIAKFGGPRKARSPSNFITPRRDTLPRLPPKIEASGVEMLAEGPTDHQT